MKKLLFIGLCFIFLLSISCKKAKKGDAIKVGIIGPMEFIQGKTHWQGALLAEEEINAAGGIKVGDTIRKIELVKADSNELRSVPDAANAMERLITQRTRLIS